MFKIRLHTHQSSCTGLTVAIDMNTDRVNISSSNTHMFGNEMFKITTFYYNKGE